MSASKQQILDALDLESVTRFEVIDHRGDVAGTSYGGRVFTVRDVAIELSLQDGERTLKVFVRDR